MNLKTIFNTLVLVLSVFSCLAQNHHTRFESIDVQHYSFEVHLNDTSNCIEGEAILSINFIKPTSILVLDLVNVSTDKKGMTVHSVKSGEKTIPFSQENKQLHIHLDGPVNAGQTIDFSIKYSGVPADGLVISENKYGERTFFGDNWPDRAKHWLPTIDHLSDKATLEFKVYAPDHYEVISNGYLVEKKQLENTIEFTHWKEDVPLSTKLMVIGVADFTVGNRTKFKNTPVSSWVFKQNEEKGFKNYKYGTEALEYFSELIGPYSYEKLAHVQSKTRYGGMENASCIFYHENTAISDRSQEGLFAHEVAHQWFGNSVTEQNWHHVWLSEGFATYLTHVYKQKFHGETIFNEGLKNDRERVIRYAKRNLAPIIDTTVTEYIKLLNANSYQKASWVLHMLRMDLGDEVFFKGLRKYYTDFQNSTALTKDFLQVMETVSGKDLKFFFKQWLWQAGHPVLECTWKQSSTSLYIVISQIQPSSTFQFPLEIEVKYENGTVETLLVNQVGQKSTINTEIRSKVKRVVLDPNIKLLFELNSVNE